MWNTLRLNHAVAVAAVQGVGGLGKTALARAYAHSRRRDYPGGQFEIAMENITTADGLKFEIISLANTWLAAGIPDELINTNLTAAFAKARAAFERPGQGKILLILDNVATDGVLSQRSGSLPSSEHVHVLATTRLDPERWGIAPLRLESLSTADALDLFLKYRPFEIPDDQQWHQAHESRHHSFNDEPQPSDTAEWKAAVGIVNRLGGHALAVEVVAVYLGNNRSILLQDYLNGLIRKGTSLKLGQAGDDPKVRARLAESIETNIAELLKPTFEKLESENPLAMQVLQWATLMPPDHVPWVWLRELVAMESPGKLQHDPDDPDPWQDGVVPILQGWQLLTGDEEQPTCRMHRIVQAAVTMHSVSESTSQEPTNHDRNIDQLLSYVTTRSDVMSRNWGRPGINWELTPLFEAAQVLIPVLGVRLGPLVDRLIIPLRQDGRLLPALKLQQQVIELEETRAASAPENADYARDLSVSCWRMGSIEEDAGDEVAARGWRQRAHDILQGMVDRGLFVSDEDHGFLNELKQMLGDA